jgi:glycerophosphoryl diester phosphodiesterase
MKIVESLIIGKKNKETCEDGIVVTDNFIAVIDGSTSKTPVRISPDMKNGRYCMLLISQFIENMRKDINLNQFCKEITNEILSIYKHTPGGIIDYESHPEKRLCASCIIYSKYQKEIWMIGDCQCMVNGVYYDNNKPDEERIAKKRVDLIKQGYSANSARQIIVPELVKSMEEGQNKSYSVIDGFNIFMPGIKIIKASGEIIMASDGYPFLKGTLADSERLLQTHLHNDPQNIDEYIATKGLVDGNVSFDDRSYIRFYTDCDDEPCEEPYLKENRQSH